MGAVATFAYSQWSIRFPEFAGAVGPAQAAEYWNEAGLYLDNTGSGPVHDVTRQALILNLITAHIAALYSPVNDGEATKLVGRISSASEGSVSVSVENNTPGTAAWWQQTKYGSAAYAALASARTFRYYAPRR
jgi:hypothetical protein